MASVSPGFSFGWGEVSGTCLLNSLKHTQFVVSAQQSSLCKLQGANTTFLTIPASFLPSSDWRLCGLSAWEQTWEFCADPEEKGFRGSLLGILGWVSLLQSTKTWNVSRIKFFTCFFYYCAQFKLVLQCIFFFCLPCKFPLYRTLPFFHFCHLPAGCALLFSSFSQSLLSWHTLGQAYS